MQRLPKKVEPRKLVHLGATFEGRVDACDLPMLAEAVHSIDSVSANIAFGIDDRSKMVVDGQIVAEVSLDCQRCLDPLSNQVVNAELHVAVVKDEDQAKDLPGDLDPWIVADSEADLVALIEEELLLSLPVVAYHDFECIDSTMLSAGEEESSSVSEKASPFDVLAQLKKQEPKE